MKAIPIQNPDLGVYEGEEHGRPFLRVFSDHDCINLTPAQALELSEILRDFAVRCAQ